MIIIFIILILIIIIFLSAYISTLNKQKNIEGYADLSSPSGISMQITDKPSESDKLIVLNELFNNVINHETALNIYDPSYNIQQISIENVDPKSAETYVSAVFKNCMNIIPILQKQDIEILQLSTKYSNGYIQSKILQDLLNISGGLLTTDSSGGITLDKIRRCLRPDTSITSKYFEDIKSLFKIYNDMTNALIKYKDERQSGSSPNVYDDWRGWYDAPLYWQWGHISTPPPKDTIPYFQEIVNLVQKEDNNNPDKKNLHYRIYYEDIDNLMYTKFMKLDKSHNLQQDEVSFIYSDMKKQFDYIRRDERFPKLSNWSDWYNFRINPEFPIKYLIKYLEIYHTNNNELDSGWIYDMLIKKTEYAIKNVTQKNNSITLLANDLHRLVYKSEYLNNNQINQMNQMNFTGKLLDGTPVAAFNNESKKKVTDKIDELSSQTILDSAANNPPMTEDQALSKIEAAVLFYIMKVVQYQELEIQNISKSALNQFKKIYSIYT